MPTNQLNTEILSFSDFKKYARGAGGGICQIQYGDGPLILKTPKLRTPFGISDYQGNEKYNMRLESNDESRTKHLFVVLSQFDDTVKRLVLLRPDLLKRIGVKKDSNPTMEMIDMLYTSIVKDGGKYPDYFTPKIITYKDYETKFFDDNKELIEVDNIKAVVQRNYRVKVMLHLESLWFVGGKFGVNIKAKQIIVFPDGSNDFGKSTCFMEFDDEEEKTALIEPIV